MRRVEGKKRRGGMGSKISNLMDKKRVGKRLPKERKKKGERFLGWERGCENMAKLRD